MAQGETRSLQEIRREAERTRAGLTRYGRRSAEHHLLRQLRRLRIVCGRTRSRRKFPAISEAEAKNCSTTSRNRRVEIPCRPWPLGPALLIR